MHVKALIAFALAFFTSIASAFEPFVVKDIRVEGIQRTEAGTVFSYLPVKVGETMDEQKAAQAIRSLFATGFFKDVRLEVEDDVLIVLVEERPAISEITINGARDINKDDLKAALKQIGLAEGRIFDRSLLDKAEQELKRQYISRGRYSAAVNIATTPLERNRVAITFNITEGEVAKIRQINIVGNTKFDEKTLLEQFTLTTPGWITWITKNDQYSKQKLSADLESLRSYYLNRGYLQFAIDSTQVSITPDKRDIYITINVTEGPQYRVSDIDIAGELLAPEEELRKLIKIQPGEIFSREKLTESTKLMGERLGNDGYAFANVNAVPELDKENKTASFTFFVDPGRRVYVRRINITGNDRTRDEVIRRELRQLEGAWYSGEKINRSKQRVDKLGFFKSVNVETPAVGGATDQVDINLNVEEKPTGNVLIGAGFSSSEKFVINGSISQNNVFGSGNALSLAINTGRINRVASLSYTNPYWTLDGVSRGFDLYLRNVDPSSLRVGRYRSTTYGGGIRFGVPVTEIDTINYGLAAENTKLDVFNDSPDRFKNFVEDFGNNNNAILGTVGFTRDRRNSIIYPTDGTLLRLSGEIGLPIADLTYYKLSYQQQYYKPLTSDLVLFLNGEIGVGDGYDDRPLPFFKNFFAGGTNSVRGYETSSIGPRDTNDEILGGSKKLVGNVELLFPVPFFSQEKSLRMSAFVDGGMVDENFRFEEMRFSTGLAVSWISPLGPLKVSLAAPLNAESRDDTEAFQFTFGTNF
jgi:outer membrane protein insertion porin family